MDCLFTQPFANMLQYVNGVSVDTAIWMPEIEAKINTIETKTNSIQTGIGNIIAMLEKIGSKQTEYQTTLTSNQETIKQNVTQSNEHLVIIDEKIDEKFSEAVIKIEESKNKSEEVYTEVQNIRQTDVLTISNRIDETRAETRNNGIEIGQIRNMDIPGVIGTVNSNTNGKITETLAAVSAAQISLTNEIQSDDNDINEILAKVRELHSDYCQTNISAMMNSIMNSEPGWSHFQEDYENLIQEYNEYMGEYASELPVPVPRPGLPSPIPDFPRTIEEIGYCLAKIQAVTNVTFYMELYDVYLTLKDALEKREKKPQSDMLRMITNYLGIYDYTKMSWQQDDRTDFVIQRVLKDNGFKDQFLERADGKIEWNGFLKMVTLSGNEYYLTQVLADSLSNFESYAYLNNTKKAGS